MKFYKVIMPGEWHPILNRISDSYDAYEVEEGGGYWAWSRDDVLNVVTGFRIPEHEVRSDLAERNG